MTTLRLAIAVSADPSLNAKPPADPDVKASRSPLANPLREPPPQSPSRRRRPTRARTPSRRPTRTRRPQAGTESPARRAPPRHGLGRSDPPGRLDPPGEKPASGQFWGMPFDNPRKQVRGPDATRRARRDRRRRSASPKAEALALALGEGVVARRARRRRRAWRLAEALGYRGGARRGPGARRRPRAPARRRPRLARAPGRRLGKYEGLDKGSALADREPEGLAEPERLAGRVAIAALRNDAPPVNPCARPIRAPFANRPRVAS